MAKYSIDESTLTNIADAIRTKKSSTNSIVVSDMADEIIGIQTSVNMQSKTVTPTTNKQTVTPDANYDGLSSVVVNAMPTATQATPSISVSSAGKITASSTQTAGYVAAGTKTATKQLTTQAAKTVTPTTSSQTAVASGTYTTGAVTVAGDANLVAGNIKSGVSIFGVAGSYEGSGGGSSGGVSDVSTSFTLELTEEMFEPGANLYTLIQNNNSFNMNNCASLEIVFEFYNKQTTDYEFYNLYFTKFFVSDNLFLIELTGTIGSTSIIVEGNWNLDYDTGVLQLIGIFDYPSTHYNLTITANGILIQ